MLLLYKCENLKFDLWNPHEIGWAWQPVLVIPAGEVKTTKSLGLIGQPSIVDLLNCRPLRDPFSKKESTKMVVLCIHNTHTHSYTNTHTK